VQSIEQRMTEALDLSPEASLGERFDALAGAIRQVAAEVDALRGGEPDSDAREASGEETMR
jgi:hypothetical protein